MAGPPSDFDTAGWLVGTKGLTAVHDAQEVMMTDDLDVDWEKQSEVSLEPFTRGGAALSEAELMAPVVNSKVLRYLPDYEAPTTWVFAAPNGRYFTLKDLCALVKVSWMLIGGCDIGHPFLEGFMRVNPKHADAGGPLDATVVGALSPSKALPSKADRASLPCLMPMWGS